MGFLADVQKKTAARAAAAPPAEPKPPRMKVQVETYKSDRDMRKGVARMARKGWTVQAQASRGRKASMHHGASLLCPPAALLTRKQHHTITFTRPA